MAENFRAKDSIDLRRDKGAVLVGRLFADPHTRPLSEVYERLLLGVVDAVLASWRVELTYDKAQAAARFVESQVVDPAITAFSEALARAFGKADYTNDRYLAVFKQHVTYYRAPREREQQKKLTELIANAEPVAETDDIVAFHLPKLRAGLALLVEVLDLFDAAAEPNRRAAEDLREATRRHDVQWAAVEGELIRLFPGDRRKQRSFHPSLRSRSAGAVETTETTTEPEETTATEPAGSPE